MYTSVSNLFALGLLVSVPLTSAYAIPQSREVARRDAPGAMAWVRSLVNLDIRHHTEAQIAVSTIQQKGLERAVLIFPSGQSCEGRGNNHSYHSYHRQELNQSCNQSCKDC